MAYVTEDKKKATARWNLTIDKPNFRVQIGMDRSLISIDLFSGCGGLTLGAHLSGMKTVHAVDIDGTLSSSFPINFPEARHHAKSVADIDERWIKKHIDKQPDAVLGGPPCQAFSAMGRNSVTDPRRKLIREYFRVVDLINPKFFLFENVAGLMTKKHRHVLEDGLQELGRNWCVLAPALLDAADYGAPTSRKRVFVFGFNRDFCNPPRIEEVIDQSGSPEVSVKDAIADLTDAITCRTDDEGNAWAKYPGSTEDCSEYALKMRAGLNEFTGHIITKHTDNTIRRFKGLKQGETDAVGRYPRLSWTAKCPTLRAGTGSDKGSYQAVRPIHPTKHRVLTPRECARLQGFPDWFIFHKSIWHSCRMIGNSVSPIIAERLIQNVLLATGMLTDSLNAQPKTRRTKTASKKKAA